MANLDFQIAGSVAWPASDQMFNQLVGRFVCWAGDDSAALKIYTGGNRKVLRVPSGLCGTGGRTALTLTNAGADQCGTTDKFVAVTAVDPGCPVAPPTPLPAPAGLAAGTITATTIPVTWSAVTDAEGYEVRWAPGGTTTWTVRPVVTATADTITGLTAETEYDIQVRAKGDGTTTADSPWSATVTASTIAAAGFMAESADAPAARTSRKKS